MEKDTQEGMVTSEDIANMRTSLGKTIEMKVGNKSVIGKWNDIEYETSTGEITGVYVGGKPYKLNEIDYFRTR